MIPIMTFWKKKSYKRMNTSVVSMGLEEVGRAEEVKDSRNCRAVMLFCIMPVMVTRRHHAFVKTYTSLEPKVILMDVNFVKSLGGKRIRRRKAECDKGSNCIPKRCNNFTKGGRGKALISSPSGKEWGLYD